MRLFQQMVCLSEMIAIHFKENPCYMSCVPSFTARYNSNISEAQGEQDFWCHIFHLIITTNNNIGFGHYALSPERRCSVCVLAGPDWRIQNVAIIRHGI